MKTATKQTATIGTMIINAAHPAWGTWGITSDNGQWLEIRGDRGSRVLHYEELRFWNIV